MLYVYAIFIDKGNQYMFRRMFQYAIHLCYATTSLVNIWTLYQAFPRTYTTIRKQSRLNLTLAYSKTAITTLYTETKTAITTLFTLKQKQQLQPYLH